jgi:hypothetical protein
MSAPEDDEGSVHTRARGVPPRCIADRVMGDNIKQKTLKLVKDNSTVR